MTSLFEMAGIVARHAPADGFHGTPIERLSLIRSSGPSLPSPGIYQPSLCLVASGAKRVTLGDRIYCYDASRYLIVTVDLPVLGHVIEATPEVPYLCVRLDLDLVTLGQLMIDCGVSAPPPGTRSPTTRPPARFAGPENTLNSTSRMTSVSSASLSGTRKSGLSTP